MEATLLEHVGQHRELEAQKEKRDTPDHAFLYEKRITRDTYDRQHHKIQIEIITQQITPSEMKIDELEVETVILFARNLLKNARNLWL